MADTGYSNSIPNPFVAQFFGFFNGVPKQHYEKIVAAAPFDQCNLLILAFVHTVQKNGVYVADFTNWRDNNFPFDPNDTDIDRVKLVVKTARQKNPSLPIIISLGWGTNDAGNAAKTPGPFADSMRAIVQTFGLNGIDIDFESTSVKESDMLTLAQAIAAALKKAVPNPIMTITPAQTGGLNGSVLKAFTYTQPQSYGNNPPYADQYEKMLGSYATIVYGMDSEGPIGDSDDPRVYIAALKANHAAGIFAWRLDNDSLDAQGFPTFATATLLWQLMNSESASASRGRVAS
jgi:Glycosyl hydrolases family 18